MQAWACSLNSNPNLHFRVCMHARHALSLGLINRQQPKQKDKKSKTKRQKDWRGFEPGSVKMLWTNDSDVTALSITPLVFERSLCRFYQTYLIPVLFDFYTFPIPALQFQNYSFSHLLNFRWGSWILKVCCQKVPGFVVMM